MPGWGLFLFASGDGGEPRLISTNGSARGSGVAESAGPLSLHSQAQTAPLRPEAQGEQSSGSLVGASKAVFSF